MLNKIIKLNNQNISLLKSNPIILIFVVYLIIGLLIFDDYGISWDETYHRLNGFVALNAIRNFLSLEVYQNLEHTNQFFIEQTRIYGAIFDLTASSLEKVFNIKDIKNVFLFKHFLNFTLFFISSCFFYKILKNRFSSQLSVLGLIFLILSPRIFAESFYNMKDLVFLSFFIISLYFAINLTNNYSYKNAIKAAITSSLVLLVKILGIIVPCIILFFFTFKSLDNLNFFKKNILIIIIYLMILFIFTISFWPLLWSNPIGNFFYVLKSFSSYDWRGGIYYFGEYISAMNIPWHYPVVWISISTPILYIVTFVFGSILIFLKIFSRFINLSKKNPNKDVWINENERIDFIFFMIFYFTLFLIIGLNSTLYTGWRHIYFIYPSIIYISLRFFEYISFKISLKYIIIFILPFLINTCYWMIKNHPYQNIYFNFLAGKNPSLNFELDYWGLSNKDTLNYILKKDKKNNIKIYILSESPYQFSLSLINKNDRKRIEFVKSKEVADYLVTNHYYQKQDPSKFKDYLDSNYMLEKEFKVDNFAINTIYKKKI